MIKDLKKLGLPYYILAGVLVAFICAALFAWVSHRPLAADGAANIFVFINQFKLVFDDLTGRAFDGVFKIPAILFLKIFPNAIGVAFYYVELIYVLHPILGVLFTMGILIKRKRPELALFPMVALATAVQNAKGIPAWPVLWVPTLFWPTLALVLTRKKGSTFDLIAIILLSIGLVFTYASVILMLGFLILICIYRYFKSRESSELLILGVLIAGFALESYGFISEHYPQHLRFDIGGTDGYSGAMMQALKQPFSTFIVFIFLGYFLTMIFAYFANRKGLKFIPLILAIVGIGSAIMAFLSENRFPGSNFSYHTSGRVLVVPFTFSVAFVMTVLFFFDPKKLFKKRLEKPTIGFVAFVGLVAVVFDVNATVHWRGTIQKVYSLIDDRPGCVYLTEEENKMFDHTGLDGSRVTQASILLQRSRSIHSVVMPSINHVMAKRGNLCDYFKEDGFRTPDLQIPFGDTNLEYSELYRKLMAERKKSGRRAKEW